MFLSEKILIFTAHHLFPLISRAARWHSFYRYTMNKRQKKVSHILHITVLQTTHLSS